MIIQFSGDFHHSRSSPSKFVILLLLILIFSFGRVSFEKSHFIELALTLPEASAQTTVQASLVRTIDTWQFLPPSPDPSGIVYLESLDTLLVSDSEVNEMPIFTGDNLYLMTLSGNLIDTLTTTLFSREPTGVAYNPTNDHLFFSDDNADEIYEMDPGPDGLYGTSDDIITYFYTGFFGSYDPEGVEFDSWEGVLFIIDGVNAEIYRVAPGANGIFDGVPPRGDDQVTSFDTASLGVIDPEGIAFNSDRGTLFIIGEPINLVAEVTTTGNLLQMIDISAANPVMPAGLAYAPGSLDSSVMNLYITDRGVDNNQDPNENDGRVYEMSIDLSAENMPPAVSAGPDQTITLLDDALLDGTVLDDGLPDPPGQVITTWSQIAGPGTVTFSDAGEVDTTASFSAAGSYLLRLTADDGEFQASDETNIGVVVPSDGGPGDGMVTGAATLDLRDDRKMKWELTNNGTEDVFITRVVVSWPYQHEQVKNFRLNGDFAKNVFDDTSPTDVPDDKPFESDANKRKLKKGDHKKLEINFTEKFKDHVQSDFTLSVEFDNGQVLNFP